MRLEAASKLIAGAVALAYVAGLVTTSVYLHRLDVRTPDPGALRSRYVYSGAIEVAIVAVALACAAYAEAFVRRAPAPPRTRVAVAVAFSLLPVVAVGLFCRFVAGMAPSDAAWSGVALVLTGLLGGRAVARLVLLAAGYPRRLRGALPRWSLGVLYGVWTLTFFGLFVWSFAGDVFDHVPQQFGGARPDDARLLVTPATRGAAAAVGLRFRCDPLLSDPVEVLFDVGDSLVLQLPGGIRVVVSKTLLAGSASSGCTA